MMTSLTPQTSIAQYLSYIHQQMIETARIPIGISVNNARSRHALEITRKRELRGV